MRTKKLISMLLLPAAFVACTDDFVEDGGYAGNKLSKGEIEDYALSVAFDGGSLSRAAYAGDSLGNPYQNFYLEPEYNDDGTIKLGNYEGLAGDMMGYCLTNGANAITNLPFYIAGYGSAGDSVIYSFGQTGLYDLSLALTQKDSTILNNNASAETIIKNAVKKVAENPYALKTDSLDPRKGLVRTNAGIMTGNYIAYFPYNKSFTEPGGIPAVAMDDLYEVENVSSTRQEALEAVNFYDYLFAVSQQTNEVKGGTKSGDVSLKPLTSALTFKLAYTAKIKEGEDKTTDSIKRITIRTIEEGAAGFTLEGKVALNSLGAIVASKSTDLIGVSFNEVELDTTSTNVKYVTIPFYPNPAITGYVIEVYNTKGQVASIEKSTAKFELGTGYLTTIDFKDLKFANATRKIFTEEDFVEEAVSGGDLQLMADIVVSEDVTVAANKPLNIKGAKKLTLSAGTYNSKLTMAAGSHLVLNGATVAAISADTLSVNAATTFNSSKTIEALTFNQNVPFAGNSAVKLQNATIGVLNNKLGNSGLLIAPIKAAEGVTGTNVTVDVLNTNGAVTFNGSGTPYVKELNLLGNAGTHTQAAVNVSTSLKADVINIAAAVADNAQTTANELVAGGSMSVQGELNASAVINNSGTLTYEYDICSTINNNESGMLMITKQIEYSGVLNNKGLAYVTGNVEGTGGSVNNNGNGSILIQKTPIFGDGNTITGYNEGYFGFTTTKLNINAGKVVVEGSINGNSNITVAEGAEFIATAANENVLLSTLGSNFINAKYTGIKVSSNKWPSSVTATSKKIYLNGDIEFTQNTALNGGLVVESDATVEATGKELTVSAVTINKYATLTIADKTNVTVNGNITNNGSYSQASDAVVWCAGIAGTGTWTDKPNY